MKERRNIIPFTLQTIHFTKSKIQNQINFISRNPLALKLVSILKISIRDKKGKYCGIPSNKQNALPILKQVINHVNLASDCSPDPTSQTNYVTFPTPNCRYSVQSTLNSSSIVLPKLSNSLFSIFQLLHSYLATQIHYTTQCISGYHITLI